MITEQEKVRARHHEGYLNVASQSTFSLGIPAGVQTQFTIEGAFNRILPAAEEEFRRHLQILDEHECLILEALPNLMVESVGNVKINLKAFRGFVQQYRYWVASLANLMGIQPNPFDQRFASWNAAAGGGVNVGVSN